MNPVERSIRRGGLFLRRRDLLAVGHTDHGIRQALVARRVFRVRHGWYSVPIAPESAVRAVRIGGRLTGASALEAYGIPVPRRARLHVAVPANACRLRKPVDRRQRLDASDDVALDWSDSRRGGDSWRVSMEDALLAVLEHESRDIAVACASALMRRRGWTRERVGQVFVRASVRARCWLALVSALDDSHGETFVRLWMLDAGIVYEQQPYVEGAGHLDLRVSPNVYVEVDGAQHDRAGRANPRAPTNAITIATRSLRPAAVRRCDTPIGSCTETGPDASPPSSAASPMIVSWSLVARGTQSCRALPALARNENEGVRLPLPLNRVCRRRKRARLLRFRPEEGG